jgi:serine/threonine-protein kinase
MASIYEARHTVLGKRVAIKVLHAHLARNAVAASRFMREARAASAIRHPNVVQVFEIGTHAGRPFIVMELLEGQDLSRYLCARGRLAASEAVDILLCTASAVAAAHSAGVIHRDLKPTNVFLAKEGPTGVRAKVVDFGVSKEIWAEKEHALTETETLLGTLEYMAPEQVRSARNATEHSDQYALGVILYELVTGRRPFAGQGRYELLHAIVTAPFATPRSLGIDLDPKLESAILRAMHREPCQRFSSVEALARELLPCASEGLRAWWRDDFQACASDIPGGAADEAPLDASAFAPAAEKNAFGSSFAPTLPEPTADKRRPRMRRSRLAGQTLLATFTVMVVVAATELRPRASAGQMPRANVIQPVSPVSPDAVEGDLREKEKLLVDLAFIEPTVSPSNAVAAPSGPPPHRVSVSEIRTLAPPSPAGSSSAASPLAPVVPTVGARLATPPLVERGYNGAPIVE